MHERYNSWYISLPSSAKQQREITKFCGVYETWTTPANVSYFHLELNAIVASRHSKSNPIELNFSRTQSNSIELNRWIDILASSKADFHCKVKETLFIRELTKSKSTSSARSRIDVFVFAPPLHCLNPLPRISKGFCHKMATLRASSLLISMMS